MPPQPSPACCAAADAGRSVCRQVWSGSRKWATLQATAGQQKVLRWHGKTGKWAYALCLIAAGLGVQEIFAESFIGWVVPVAIAALGGLVVFSAVPPEDAPYSSAGGEDETAPLV